MRVVSLCLVSGLAVLAACTKAPPGNSAAPAAPAAKSAAPTALFAQPHPRPGLWRMTMSTDTGPGVQFSGELCLDQKTESSAFEASGRGHSDNCGAPHFGSSPAGMTFDSICKMQGRTITSHGVATGDFSNSYTVDITAHIEPAPRGLAADTHTRMSGQWLGPCKPDQTPGRMTGMKMIGIGRG